MAELTVRKVKESLSEKVNREMTLKEQISLTMSLSAPAIMAQLSSICMQYIDAAMVGSLGALASAAIGLMMAPLWLFTGICLSSVSGYSVQVAHLLGARDEVAARAVLRQAYVVMLGFAALVAALGCAISPVLPYWLGSNEVELIAADASSYFMVFMAGLPFFMFNYLSAAMLRCSGNMLLPSLLNVRNSTCGIGRGPFGEKAEESRPGEG